MDAIANQTVGEIISARIKVLRAQRDISLQDLADRAGTSKSHIWEMEQGRSRNPTVSMAVSIANALGVSLDYLTGLSSTEPNLHPEALRIACEVDALIRGNHSHFPAIHLVRLGDHVHVNIEVGGKWITVIKEFADAPFSHIVEPSGIEAAIAKASA